MARPTKDEFLNALKNAIQENGGAWITQDQFFKKTKFSNADVASLFTGWKEAVAATGLGISYPGERVSPLQDWGNLVRNRRTIPTKIQYKLYGTYGLTVFERNFGAWSGMPDKFREFAQGKPEWNDVVTLLPLVVDPPSGNSNRSDQFPVASTIRASHKHKRLEGRPTYGDPIDFRGLRHAPVNENGVVFLFGMVARELGYLVEAVQIGFPDCEAKRQMERGKWQRVRIEFEFESRNFLDHGHVADNCDVLVCWRHNWQESPANLEIVEPQSVIQTLAKSDD